MDPRPRNNQGQFASQSIDGIDANTTSTAYNPQVIEQRKLSLIEKIRRMRGVRNGVEESVPQQQFSMNTKLRLRELARQTYDPYAPQPAQPGQFGKDFRNAAIGVGALGAGAGVAYAGWQGSQAAKSAQAAAKSAQTLTDDALKTSGEARKAARGARVAAARVGRAGQAIKTQLTTFPTFKKVGSAIFRAGRARYLFETELKQKLVELAEKSGRLVEFATRKEREEQSRWGAVSGGISGAIGGAGVGGYIGAAHPESVKAYIENTKKNISESMTEGLQDLNDQRGESWKRTSPQKPMDVGPFTQEEKMARHKMQQLKKLKKTAVRRIMKTAGGGALIVGGLGALGGYAASKSGQNGKAI